LLLVLATAVSAACRVYDVDVYRNANGEVLGTDGVSQSFICTSDSLLWAEFFVGAANSRGHYDISVQTEVNGGILYSGQAEAGSGVDYEYARAQLEDIAHVPLIKGKTYYLKVTHSDGDSINFYYSPWDPYPLGIITVPGGSFSPPPQTTSPDLCARIEGVNRAVSREYAACNGELYSIPNNVSWPVKDSLARLMVDAGIGLDREVLHWYEIQYTDSASWDWTVFDAVMTSTARKGIKVLAVLGPTPRWACTHIDSIRDRWVQRQDSIPLLVRDTFRAVWCPPRNLYQCIVDSADQQSVNNNNFWGRFVFEAVRRYGPNGTFWSDPVHSELPLLPITDWEVWNEPNDISNFWKTPDTGFGYPVPHQMSDSFGFQESLYARLCDVAVQAAKKADPGAQVMVGSLGGVCLDGLNSSNPGWQLLSGKEWLRGYYQYRESTGTYGVTVHPYQYGDTALAFRPSVFARDLDTIRAILQANGEGNKPLWATEIAWSMGTAAPENKSRAPLSLPGIYLMGLAGTPTSFLDRVFWYDLAPAWSDCSSGLYHLNWESDWAVTPQPCSYAFRQMTGELQGKRLNGRVLSGDSATDAKTRVYELEDTATHRKTWVGWRNRAAGAAAVTMRIPARTDQLDIVPLARSADADRLVRRLAVDSDGWLGLELDTIPVYVLETGAISRPDLKVDSVWTSQIDAGSEAQVTIFARVRNFGSRQFSANQGRNGSFLSFRADSIQIDPASEPQQIPPDGIAIIQSKPITLTHGKSLLVAAEANPSRAVIELSWDNNVEYSPLVVR
jgi:hypothetical protein